MTQQIEGEYVPSPWDWVRNQVDAYERSGGRTANGLGDSDWPVVVVTCRGRRTGAIRKCALMRVEHDGEYALIGSLGGAPRNPVWVYNLRAHPDSVTLQDGPEPFAVTVREVTGGERDLWWQRAVAAYPPYADYQKRTERLIPVFVASPRRSEAR
jgi:F420H(2)-dependent quinone reductase